MEGSPERSPPARDRGIGRAWQSSWPARAPRWPSATSTDGLANTEHRQGDQHAGQDGLTRRNRT